MQLVKATNHKPLGRELPQTVEANLFPAAHAITNWDRFPWHSDGAGGTDTWTAPLLEEPRAKEITAPLWKPIPGNSRFGSSKNTRHLNHRYLFNLYHFTLLA